MAKNYDDSDGRWVTINGRRVFIAEGQSLGDAMKKSGKFGSTKTSTKGFKNKKDVLAKEDKFKGLTEEGKRIASGNFKSKEEKEAWERAGKETKELLDMEKASKGNVKDVNFKDFDAKRDLKIGDTYIDGQGNLNKVVDRPDESGLVEKKLAKLFVPGQQNRKGTEWKVDTIRKATKEDYAKYPSVHNLNEDGKYTKMLEDKTSNKNEPPKERTYEQVNKEWKDQASKMEKNYKEFGGNTIEDEKKLNDLSRERDSMQYKLSSKEVKDANAKYESDEIKQDVLENFGEDYDASRTPEENLRDQIDSMRNPGETLQQTCERYVEGGNYLVYNDTIKDYLDKHNVKYNDDNFFDKYKQTMADKMVEVYNGDSKSESRTYEQADKELKDHMNKMRERHNETNNYSKDDVSKFNQLAKERDDALKRDYENRGKKEEIFNNSYTRDEQDILDRYSEDYGYDKGDNLKNLKGQIDDMRNPGGSIHRTAERLVEGGDFLIYNEDVKDYLDERGIKYNEDNFFDKYKKDMADKIERLYNSESPKKTTNETMNDAIRNKASKTKADRNIDAFDDTRSESDRRIKGKAYEYSDGKVGNMKTSDYVKQRKEYLDRVNNLFEKSGYNKKEKELSDKTKAGEMTRKQFYDTRKQMNKDIEKDWDNISKDYADEVVTANKYKYDKNSNVIKKAIERMSNAQLEKTKSARMKLDRELNPGLKNALYETQMYKDWIKYKKTHPNTSLTEYRNKNKNKYRVFKGY